MRTEYLVAEVAAAARGQVRVQDSLDVERDAVRERDLAVRRADRLERRERGRACSARAHAVKLRRRRDTRRRQEVELGVALALVNGWLIGEREPTQVDVEAVIAAAARTGTALEINASPHRLDLRDVHARRARDLGAPLVIDSDAHITRELSWHMRFGVHTARRAWCGPEHILNTRPLAEFERFLRTPKAERGR